MDEDGSRFITNALAGTPNTHREVDVFISVAIARIEPAKFVEKIAPEG